MSTKTRYLKLMDRPRKGWKLTDRAAFLRRYVEEATALIEEGLARDGVVKIHEFGSFQLKWSDARQGRNPRTGEIINIPGQYRVAFNPVEKLERRVNWPYVHLQAEFIDTPVAREKPRAEPVPEVVPAAVPEAIPLFDLEDEYAEPVRQQEVHEPVQPAYVRPALAWSPASPPPSHIRFDFGEEEEPAPARNHFGKGNGQFAAAEHFVGEVETRPSGMVPATVSSPSLASRVRRPSYMQEKEREPKPSRFKWYASFGAILLLLLLFFAKPIREQWNHLAESTNTETSSPAQTAPQEANQAANAATPATSQPASTVGFGGGKHQVVKGDNLWGISGHYYVDPYLWPNIYRVNTDKIGNPDVLEPRQLLSLPVLYGTYDQLSPQDRRNLAEGYFLVFNHYKQTQTHLAPFALWAAVRFDSAILEAHQEVIGEEEMAFLKAHNVGNIAAR